MYYTFRLFFSRYICPVLNNMSVTITLYVPQCIQQVFSLKLFGLVFQQSYASLDINTRSLDEGAVRVHVVVKDDQADQYSQHEKMSFLFSKLNGTVKHNKMRVIVLLHSKRMWCPMILGNTIITLRNFDYLIAEKLRPKSNHELNYWTHTHTQLILVSFALKSINETNKIDYYISLMFTMRL